MKQILCASPVIILNPHLRYKLSQLKSYRLNGTDYHLSDQTLSDYYYDFPFHKFSPKLQNITIDNMDSNYLFSKDSSVVVDMYMQVPCGKCPLCRAKKAKEWSFRAVAENTSSTSEPLFLTLTYNNDNLPSCGIFKEEIQLFMKRLRRNLDRRSIPHNLRYVAVGEYGSKSQRPHYHMILWNFPDLFDTLHAKLKFIEDSWRVPTGQYESTGKPITQSIGFAYCVPCSYGGINYVMKYLKKDAIIPFGKNPTFFLSSRRNGGIGSAYGRSLKDFYRKNPQCLDISVRDPFSNMILSIPLPNYYKNMFFPPNSMLVDKSVSDAYQKLMYLLSQRRTLWFNLTDEEEIYRLTLVEQSIIKKFNFLSSIIPYYYDDKMDKIYSNYSLNQKRDLHREIDKQIDYYVRFLSMCSYDSVYVGIRDHVLSIRKTALLQRYSSLDSAPIDELVFNLNSRNKLAYLKEVI